MSDRLFLSVNKIISPTLKVVEGNSLIIEDGKIIDIVSTSTLPAESDAKRYSDPDALLYPGFIEAHGHITVVGDGTGSINMDGNDYADPIAPHLRIADSMNLDSNELTLARSEGILAVGLFPGSASLISGQGTMIRTTSNSYVIDDVIIKDTIGLKLAFGENPKRLYSAEKKFYTRMGAIGKLREYFQAVQNYMTKKHHHFSTEETKTKPFEENMKYEVGARLLNREFPARAHAHQANDIQNAIKLAEEFAFDIVIEHGTESELIIDFIAERKIPVVVGPINFPGLKIESRRRNINTPGALSKSGVLTAIMTDAPVYSISFLRLLAGLCMKDGMDYWAALQAITVNAAKICGVDDRYGDITKGLEAHLILWKDDPLTTMQAKVLGIVEGTDVLSVKELNSIL